MVVMEEYLVVGVAVEELLRVRVQVVQEAQVVEVK
jgi:hypothetical protein